MLIVDHLRGLQISMTYLQLSTSTLFNKLRGSRLCYRSINYLQIIIKRWQNE